MLPPVPLPNELDTWDATLVTNLNKQKVSHPNMISKTMNHVKHLSSKMYPDDITRDIKNAGPISNDKVCLLGLIVDVAGEVRPFCSTLQNNRECKQ